MNKKTIKQFFLSLYMYYIVLQSIIINWTEIKNTFFSIYISIIYYKGVHCANCLLNVSKFALRHSE